MGQAASENEFKKGIVICDRDGVLTLVGRDSSLVLRRAELDALRDKPFSEVLFPIALNNLQTRWPRPRVHSSYRRAYSPRVIRKMVEKLVTPPSLDEDTPNTPVNEVLADVARRALVTMHTFNADFQAPRVLKSLQDWGIASSFNPNLSMVLRKQQVGLTPAGFKIKSLQFIFSHHLPGSKPDFEKGLGMDEYFESITQTLEGRKVAVIDDNPNLVMAMHKFLRERGISSVLFFINSTSSEAERRLNRDLIPQEYSRPGESIRHDNIVCDPTLRELADYFS